MLHDERSFATQSTSRPSFCYPRSLFRPTIEMGHIWTDGIDAGIRQIGIATLFDLYRIHNGGISFGLFEATSEEWRWFLVAITALIALVVLVWILREKVLGEIIGLSMVLGGALGNIIDRARYGYVLDYADLHIGDFRPFLIFNVADAAITIGVLIILARSLFVSEKDKRV